jgi:hypothetical protein
MRNRACRSETFRRNRRAEGMRNMEIWLQCDEIEAIDRLKVHLNLTSRSQAMSYLIATLCAPINAQIADLSTK